MDGKELEENKEIMNWEEDEKVPARLAVHRVGFPGATCQQTTAHPSSMAIKLHNRETEAQDQPKSWSYLGAASLDLSNTETNTFSLIHFFIQ